MKILEMTQVGRYYYDPKRPVAIPQHKLELWPGYITAIEHYEGNAYSLSSIYLLIAIYFTYSTMLLLSIDSRYLFKCHISLLVHLNRAQ